MSWCQYQAWNWKSFRFHIATAGNHNLLHVFLSPKNDPLAIASQTESLLPDLANISMRKEEDLDLKPTWKRLFLLRNFTYPSLLPYLSSIFLKIVLNIDSVRCGCYVEARAFCYLLYPIWKQLQVIQTCAIHIWPLPLQNLQLSGRINI